MDEKLVRGLDFGSDSVRALAASALNGAEISSAVAYDPSWYEGPYNKAAANQFRHHPLNYIESMTIAVRETVTALSETQQQAIVGIGVDSTASTPAPLPGFSDCTSVIATGRRRPSRLMPRLTPAG